MIISFSLNFFLLYFNIFLSFNFYFIYFFLNLNLLWRQDSKDYVRFFSKIINMSLEINQMKIFYLINLRLKFFFKSLVFICIFRWLVTVIKFKLLNLLAFIYLKNIKKDPIYFTINTKWFLQCVFRIIPLFLCPLWISSLS